MERKYGNMGVYDRLTQSVDRLESRSKVFDQPTFIPQINPISDELDNRMKVTEVGKERWQTLYELGVKKREELDQYRLNL